jgi:LysR family transcriptional regulator, transcriptional activator for bauABCD operon
LLGKFSDLDLRLVRVYLAVVEAGGISAAQMTLNVGSSTISTQLSTLETRLGFRLCERGRSGFKLTPKGVVFAEMAHGLMNAVGDFHQGARNLDKQLVGHLRIGLIGHMPPEQNDRISKAIARFRQRDEAVRMTLIVRPPAELEERLLNGQLDLAFAYSLHRVPALHFTPVFTERQEAYCSHEHPLFARAGAVQAEEVNRLDWAWRSYPLPETGLAGLPVRVGATADNMEALALLIFSGRHLGFLPRHFAAPYVAQGRLAPLNPKSLYYDIDFCLVTRPRRQINAVTKAFLDDFLRVDNVARLT